MYMWTENMLGEKPLTNLQGICRQSIPKPILLEKEKNRKQGNISKPIIYTL